MDKMQHNPQPQRQTQSNTHPQPRQTQRHAAAHAAGAAPQARRATHGNHMQHTRRTVSNQAHLLDSSAYSRQSQSAYANSKSSDGMTRRGLFKAAAALAAVAGVGATGVYLVRNPPLFDVSINGTTYRVSAGTTLQGAIKDGLASPKPGNLMAVDGSVAAEGKGDIFAATINGKKTNNPASKLVANAIVTISDGADTTEDYSEKTEKIPFETKSDDFSTLDSYFRAALHVYSKGSEGEKTTRTGKVSGKTISETTKEPIDAGYHIIDANVGDEKVVALTFDDGPWETTPQLLDVLKENDIHVTFFVIGNQVAEHADTVKREHAEGHQVATHTWDHAAGAGQGVNLTYMTAEEQKNEITKGLQAIEDCLGTKVTHLLRAPGGNFYGEIVNTLSGMIDAEIGWNLDTEDWSRPGAQSIENTIKSAKPGQVILCHDGGGDRTQTIEAVKKAVPYLKEQGFKFVTIDELFEINNKYAGKADAKDDKSKSDDGTAA